MKLSRYTFLILFVVLLATFAYAAEDGSDIKRLGFTTIGTTHLQHNVKITFETVIIDRANIAFPSWDPIKRDLKSVENIAIIKEINISVDDQKVYVPYSVFADLINPTKALMGFSGGTFVLTIEGGDAGYSYFLHVYFDTKQVLRRAFYGSLVPDKPAQETQYWNGVLDDAEEDEKGTQK